MSIKNILIMGMFGITCEIVFTSLFNLINDKDKNLVGECSLWMLPIYGIGFTYGFDFIKFLIPGYYIRIFSYPFWIWGIEILVGKILLQINIKAWNYKYLNDNFHWEGLISYVHAPAWIFLGIITEYIKTILL